MKPKTPTWFVLSLHMPPHSSMFASVLGPWIMCFRNKTCIWDDGQHLRCMVTPLQQILDVDFEDSLSGGEARRCSWKDKKHVQGCPTTTTTTTTPTTPTTPTTTAAATAATVTVAIPTVTAAIPTQTPARLMEHHAIMEFNCCTAGQHVTL